MHLPIDGCEIIYSVFQVMVMIFWLHVQKMLIMKSHYALQRQRFRTMINRFWQASSLIQVPNTIAQHVRIDNNRLQPAWQWQTSTVSVGVCSIVHMI